MTKNEAKRMRTGPLDGTDRDIIAMLQSDGRTSNREIGRTLGISEATVRNRIGRLTEDGLINIVAVPTPVAVGLTMSAIIGVSVQLPRLDEVVNTVVGYREVFGLFLGWGGRRGRLHRPPRRVNERAREARIRRATDRTPLRAENRTTGLERDARANAGAQAPLRPSPSCCAR